MSRGPELVKLNLMKDAKSNKMLQSFPNRKDSKETSPQREKRSPLQVDPCPVTTATFFEVGGQSLKTGLEHTATGGAICSLNVSRRSALELVRWRHLCLNKRHLLNN